MVALYIWGPIISWSFLEYNCKFIEKYFNWQLISGGYYSTNTENLNSTNKLIIKHCFVSTEQFLEGNSTGNQQLNTQVLSNIFSIFL